MYPRTSIINSITNHKVQVSIKPFHVIILTAWVNYHR